ncbi:MAG: ribosomal-processing cysteine protease Prp [Porcipelethomonas sp.]
MTVAEFFKKDGEITGFKIKGHSGYSESGSDIVCASVSSAVMMAANMITEIFRYQAEVSAVEDTVFLKTDIPGDKVLQGIYNGLRLQLEEIAGEYGKKYLKMKFTEV